MDNALLDKLELDGTNATVVHVGRGNAVGTGLGIGESNVRNTIDRQLVVETAIIAQNTAVTVGSVLAEADVDSDIELRESLPQEADAADDGTLRIIGSGSQSILGTGLKRNTEENDGAKALVNERLEEGNEFVDTAAVLVRERRDKDFFVVVVGNE